MEFDDGLDDEVFGLQATLATMQAEVSQYEQQTQKQQATIRQLQNEVSQANLQRNLLREKLQKEQEKNNSSLPKQHSSSEAAAAWPPLLAARSASHDETFPPVFVAAYSGGGNTSAGSLSRPSPPGRDIFTVNNNNSKAMTSNEAGGLLHHNRHHHHYLLETTMQQQQQLSLGMYLSRTLLLANNDEENFHGGPRKSQHQHQYGYNTTTTTPTNTFWQAMIWQKLDPAQDTSLLSFFLEHSSAYAWQQEQQKNQQQQQQQQEDGRHEQQLQQQHHHHENSNSKNPPSAPSPLPWLYHALVFCQTRLPHESQLKRQRRLRCRIRTGSQNQSSVGAPATSQERLEEMWIEKRRPRQPLSVSKELLRRMLRTLISYVKVLMNQSLPTTTQEEQDMLHIFRILALPVLADTVEVKVTAEGSDEDLLSLFENNDILWEWITRHLQSRIQTRPGAPRRFVGLETTHDPVSWSVLTAALWLGRTQGMNNTNNTGAATVGAADIATPVLPPQPWMRSIVGITCDFVHFTLLPCFSLYRPRRTGSTGQVQENTDSPILVPSAELTIDNKDELAGMACEIVKMWQSWGTDCDWLRTQLALPRKDENDAHQSSSAAASGRIHAPGILQLACRLLQAIALDEEENPRNEINPSGNSTTWSALQRHLLLFLGPVVARHPAWFELSLRLEYTSALAHFKAHGSKKDDALVLACWASALEENFMAG